MSISRQESTMKAADGESILIYDWNVPEPTADVYIVHGWAEHAARYEDVAQALCEAGYGVHALDHRGHGRSGGVRGHTDRWTDYTRDLRQLMERDSGRDKLVIGHSMGGCISALFALEYPGVVERFALSGPATDISLPVPPLKAAIGRLLSNLLPKVTLPNDVDPKHVCTVEDVVRDYESDPLVHNKVSTRFFVEYVATIDRIKREASKINTPIAIWHGGEDRVVEPWISEQFFARLTCEPRKRKVIDHKYHEILFEDNGPEILAEMIAWFEGRNSKH